jgi:hypothetical protein
MADIHSSKHLPTNSERNDPLFIGEIKLPKFEERIVTGWRRFSSGLWRVKEGDIAAAYCADKFPNLKAFVEGGHVFTNMGMAFHEDIVEAHCHLLLPVGSVDVPKKPYSHEGEIGKFKGRSWLLGPQVTFVADDPPVLECQKLLRIKYADGGYFANQPSYGEFLESLTGRKTPNGEVAIKMEQRGNLLKLSKSEMLSLLDAGTDLPSRDTEQLNLFQ